MIKWELAGKYNVKEIVQQLGFRFGLESTFVVERGAEYLEGDIGL